MEDETFLKQYPELQFCVLKRDPFCVCVSKESPLAEYQTISMKEFYPGSIDFLYCPSRHLSHYSENSSAVSPSQCGDVLFQYSAVFPGSTAGPGRFLVPASSQDNPLFQQMCSDMVHIPIQGGHVCFCGISVQGRHKADSADRQFSQFSSSPFFAIINRLYLLVQPQAALSSGPDFSSVLSQHQHVDQGQDRNAPPGQTA